ncbi:hypothetical protein ACJIZ3_016069 [Penstemon smallii]|uniref:WRKY domain-containing protein n=1 Tax=Penstemon smallii TaxID=265156 RepID=A0ABD3RSP7_9LAMI
MEGQETPARTDPQHSHSHDVLTPPIFFDLHNSLFPSDVGLSSLNDDEDYMIIKNKRNIGKPCRFAFQTRSEEDILDDGYRWRKYGQKAVKNSNFPRSYYRCTHHTCNVKKQIQRLSKSKENGVVVTTYEGIHNHPCEKLMETLTPLLKQIQFLTTSTHTLF